MADYLLNSRHGIPARLRILASAVATSVIATACVSPGPPAAGSPAPITRCPPGDYLVCRSKDSDRFDETKLTFCTCESVPGLP